MRQRCFSCVEACFSENWFASLALKLFFPAFMPRCSALSFQNANIRICFHSETDFTFKFRVPVSILSQILVTGVEFCHEGVVGLGHGCRLRGFAPVAGFTCANRGLLPSSFFTLFVTGANRGFLPPSAFMDVVPNCGKGPLSSGCFASGIPQGRHLQMPGRSWRAGQPSGDGKPVGPDVPP